jgi:Flp pilus assembly protein TadG
LYSIIVDRIFKPWWRSCEGIAATEAAMIFPMMLVLLVGTFDLGNAILSNQKTIRASQVAADLVTRSRSIDTTGLNEAIEAARLAFEPLSSASFGVDIVSVRFDDEGDAEIVWRETRNMSPIADIASRVSGMSEPGNGVVVVAINYDFVPVFSGFAVDTILMQEIAFARGRKSPVVTRI